MLQKLLLTKRLLFIAMLFAGLNSWAQTNPTAQTLPYTQDFSTFDGTQTTHLAGWQGWTLSANLSTSYNTAAANGNIALTVGANTTTSRAITDMTGKMGIISTSGSAGAIALAVVTTGWQSISVSYKAATQRTENSRLNGLGLQYRVGTSGAFTDVAASEYQNQVTPTNTTGTDAVKIETISVTLPAAANNATVVQLRWIIRDISGSGNRPGFSIDDVSVSGTATGPTVTTDAATIITATTARLNGKVKANNTTVATSFEYGLTTSYGTTVTATTPSSITGNTETSYYGTAGSVTALTPNTTYNYRAVGNNGTAYNGSNATFVTLANVPGAPAISGATTSSLSVTLNSTTQNSNPATTQYAIQLTGNSQYVQANGTQGATAVWQTAAAWGTKVVTGLAANTQYTFHVKARNGATVPVETAFGTSASAFTLANTSPMLAAGTITTFGNVCINTTPADKSFILDGSNLTGDITVGPLTGFTFSTTSNGTFTPSLTLTPVSGSVLTDIYVRFTPTLVQSYNGNIAISGGSASTINVAAAGSGVNTQATVTTAAASSITGTTATLGGNVTVQGCGTVNRGVVYATTATPAVGGTGVTNLSGGTGTGAFTANATGLTAGTTYHVRAYATNNAGTVYGSEVTFATPPANDLCANAATLTVNATATNGTFVGSTYTTFTNGGSNKDVWYKFTAACTGSHTITLADFTGDADLFLFSGASCPSNNNSNIGNVQTANIPEIITANLTSGVTYYIRAVAWDPATETSAFTIRVQSVDAVPTVTTSTASAITYQSATIPGTAVVAGCSTAVGSGYGIYYSTTSGFADGAGTQVVATNMAGTSFSVNLAGLTPLTTYYYKAYATNGAGTGYSTQGSFVTAAFVIDAPVATAATNISTSGFTANWNSVTGATSYRLDVSESATFGSFAPTTNLIISEYGEGSTGNKKYIEIYNGTGQTVNLENYQIWKTTNNAVWTSATKLSLTGTLDNEDTYVIANNASDVAGADLYNSGFCNWNGDDPIGLYYNGGSGTTFSLIDAIGDANGIDPGTGWPVAGTNNATVDKILIRKSTISSPNANWAASSGTNETNSEWIVSSFTYSATNQTTDLGAHTYNGQQDDLVPGYANLTVNGLSHDVTGLDAGTTYYYRVRAFANSTTSVNSNAISALTGFIKTWDNGAWSGNGDAPTVIDDAVIQDNYNTITNGTFNAAKLTVSEGKLTVAKLTSITVNGSIIIAGGQMEVESNANVLQINENAVNSGLVTINRESPALKRLDYKLWSSPVSGQIMNIFSPATESSRFYSYNTATNQYNGFSDEGAFGKGSGYLIRVPNNHNATTATKWNGVFKGTPYNGYTEVGVAYYPADAQANLPIRGYNLIGNPYMSTISAGDFYQANAGKIDGTLYFWRKANATAGSAYVAYTAGLGGTGDAGDAIQVGQGFIVNVTSPSATNLVFNNQMRVANTDDLSYRSAQATEKHRFWLNLTNAAGANSQVLVGYTTNATNGIDSGIDGKLLADNSATLYTVAAATKLMIQGRPLPFATTDAVVLGYKAIAAVNHKITLDHFDGLFASGQHVYLKDKALNVIHDLNGGDYTFATAIGTFEDRFEIVYTTDGALGTDNPVASAESIAVYKDGNVLNVASGNTEIAALAIYDIRGRLLYSNDNVNTNETSVTTLQAAQQVLVVQVTTANGSKVSKKVVF